MADNPNTLDQSAATSTTSASIVDGTIVDADINASAAIAESKVASLTTDLAAKMAKASNLSDLASASTARTNLGLGGAATLSVGTTAGTVAAGDDSRITGAAQKASNLSDLASASTARTNLGLGNVSTRTVGAGSGQALSADTVTAKGSILAASANATLAELTVGVDGQIPQADSSKTAGLRYASAQEVGGFTIPSDHGYVGWTLPPFLAGSNALFSTEVAAGVLGSLRIRRVPAASITDITIYVATAGSVLANCGAALYTSAGALIAQTADMSSTWGGTGLKDMSLTGGPFVTTAGDLYVSLWWNGTTAPKFMYTGGFAGTLTNAGLAAASSLSASSDSAITTTPPSNLGTKTARTILWWVALKGTRQ